MVPPDQDVQEEDLDLGLLVPAKDKTVVFILCEQLISQLGAFLGKPDHV